jgi:FkbM family methyltransferase
MIDVGAKRGQYGADLRSGGYWGPLISFEPLGDIFAELLEAARGDKEWQSHRIALGNRNGDAAVHRAADPTCSSVLEVGEEHAEKDPDWGQIGDEIVPVRRLDSVAGSLVGPRARLFLKLDVQGFELAVLEGW